MPPRHAFLRHTTAVLAAASMALGAATTAAATQVAPAPASQARARYVQLADQGLHVQSARWRTGTDHWFCESLGCTGAYPLLTIWGVVRMFEAADAVELAAPSPAHRATVESYAGQAEKLYWNKYLNGFDPYPGDNFPAAQAWFDDNGWLGLAFVDAYRATGERRWLGDAQRALDFIAARGWSGGGRGAGMWWNTQHQQHSGEALAADSLLAVLLYDANRKTSDLRNAQRWIDWANANDVGYAGLYDSEGPGSSVIDYVESPLIYAQYRLCQDTGHSQYCDRAAAQAKALSRIYGVAYNLAPLYDSIFFQWMMAYDRATGDTHWIGVAAANASAAISHARTGQGLWLGSWWGGAIHDRNTQPNMFRTVGGTTSLFAWLAYYGG
jgi:hypothetical protein